MTALPLRNTPRRRREVPRVVLSLLAPLFRYSYFRQAWILRGIGERFGPVLRQAGGDSAYAAVVGENWPDQQAQRSPRLGAPLAALGTTAVVVAAALGFVAARPSGAPHSRPASRAIPSYAAGFSRVMSRLGSVNVRANSQLRAARTGAQQARAAGELAVANMQAGAALLQLRPGAASDANSAIASGLSKVGTDYAALEDAAARNDAAGYMAASDALTRAESRLSSAYSELSMLGYRIG